MCPMPYKIKEAEWAAGNAPVVLSSGASVLAVQLRAPWASVLTKCERAKEHFRSGSLKAFYSWIIWIYRKHGIA